MKRATGGGLYPGMERESQPKNVAAQTEPMFRPDAVLAGSDDDDTLEGIGGGPIDAIVDAFAHYTD